MAASNPNTFNYWIRGGSVLPGPVLGNVRGTGGVNYWARGGTIIFPAVIAGPEGPAVSNGNFFLLMGM